MELTSDFFDSVRHVLSPVDQIFDIQIDGLRAAAVLLLLVFEESEWKLLFIHRADAGEFHRGEVAFPGGSREEGDKNLVDTALRETFEELGIPPLTITVLGCLPSISTVTNFHVTPIVATTVWPIDIKLNENEVKHIFTIPLKWLANSDNWEEKNIEIQGRGIIHTIAYHDYKEEHLWGVTGRITNGFTQLLTKKAIAD